MNWITYSPQTFAAVTIQCLEGIPRKAYYLATKVGRYEKDPSLMFDFSAEKSKRSIEDSLSRLGTDYVDVIQVSFRRGPNFFLELSVFASTSIMTCTKTLVPLILKTFLAILMYLFKDVSLHLLENIFWFIFCIILFEKDLF
ncbi:unnamed protein product [Acanthoscelides obtectus]|uniref:NADP-dependent oxidoreductase domain-containing protein n=1 Tax=Acanthoscelides obtectus TaxID=200917 RepID=A0A9P0KSS2_ACAOB|nr:unnamed protein product [Acanthoscelides obtectus]CAK1669202.1 L-galactose dehydrogenase [Acanthoscelides obtectus]